MQNFTISTCQPTDIEAARDQAVRVARETLHEPVVLSWRDDRSDAIAPEIPGSATPVPWKDYGIANGGKLEVDVGEQHHFILGEAVDFTEPHSLLTNIRANEGSTYLCVTGACTDQDLRFVQEGLGSYGGRGG